jgi:hypothetical protein
VRGRRLAAFEWTEWIDDDMPSILETSQLVVGMVGNEIIVVYSRRREDGKF